VLAGSADLTRLVRSQFLVRAQSIPRCSQAGIASAKFSKVPPSPAVCRHRCDRLRALVAKFKGEVTAEVTVAEPLSDKNLDALKAALKSVSGKDVDLNVKVDPSIIGGLVVKLGSRMVDSSLRTKLNSIKHAMKEAG
jgi:F-type H+-transporting ATPase subunit delta